MSRASGQVPPLVVLVGPTASGKSAAAMSLAKIINGEIICADSRTIYIDMDIGTAKPSPADQLAVRHYGIDIVAPDQSFSAANFQELAQRAIMKIADRGKVPIIVGGTGLYVDSILYDFSFAGAVNPDLRSRLQTMSVDELQTEILERDLPIPRNENNPRHLIRTIERGGVTPQDSVLRAHTLAVGLQIAPDELKSRIYDRVDSMFAQGLDAEIAQLYERYGWDAPGMLTIGYREWQPYFEGTASREQTKQFIQKATWQYARRQLTWFRRNKDIHWCDSPEHINDLVIDFLNKNTAWDDRRLLQ